MMTPSFGRIVGEGTLRWCDETLAVLRALEREKGAEKEDGDDRRDQVRT